MLRFIMNGYLWRVIFVDPSDYRLIDRSNTYRVATTDPEVNCIFLSNELSGDFLTHVLIHELGHATMISYGLLNDIHRMVYPKYWIEAEEWACNFIADYGTKIYQTAYSILGKNALMVVPRELESLVS